VDPLLGTCSLPELLNMGTSPELLEEAVRRMAAAL
jgi:hypothetical protein